MKVIDVLKPVFKHYFLENNAIRHERMWECVEYEKNNIYNVLLNMLSYFSQNKKTVFILDNLHNAPISSIKLTKFIIDNKHNRNISINAGFDYLYSISEYKTIIWNNFIDELDVEGYLINLETNNSLSKSKTINKFDSRKINEYLSQISNNLEFLELEDTINELEYIYNKVTIEKVHIDHIEEFRPYELYACAYTLCSRHNDTLLICDNMIANCDSNFSEYKIFTYDYYKGRTHIILGQQEAALEYMEDALVHAIKENNEFHIMLSKMMLTIIKYSSHIHDVTYSKEIDKLLFKLLEKYNYYNHMIILLCICSENKQECYENQEAIETKAKCYQKAVQMAISLENKRLLYSIYRFFLVKTATANYSFANKYFHEKYLQIIEKGTKDEMYAQIGMGYMAEIIYNMSMNAFVAQDFDNAIKYSNICIWIMVQMSYPKLFVCNIAKLHAIKALCYYRQNRKYLCLLEHQIMQRNTQFEYKGVEKKQNLQDLFFYYYIGALLLHDNKDYEIAKTYFQNAENYLVQLDDQYFISYVPFMLDKACLYNNLKDIKTANELINNAISYCKKIIM